MHNHQGIKMILTPEQLATAERLMSILFPYAVRRRNELQARNGRFVHYTSADNALKIINTKCIWMRNTTCMSDFREVRHGLDALNRYFSIEDGTRRQAFVAALDQCSAGVAGETFNLFNQWWQKTELQTYITSISEHDDREDIHGRLSMWRAFGNSTARVAIVIKLNTDVGRNVALGAVLSPVGYFTDAELFREFDLVTTKIRENVDFLRGMNRNVLLGSVLEMLTTTVVSLKHEGFHEEREWRIVHSPARRPSPHLPSTVEVVAGVPQRVYKIPFQNRADANLTALSPNEMLDRIIIGPSQFPWAMYEAFVEALEAAGVADASNRVFTSQIPVRS